jgi:tetratricopeptide (TPR) repeat protein
VLGSLLFLTQALAQTGQTQPQLKYTNEEYNDLNAALREKDLQRQVELFEQFSQKHPKSELLPTAFQAYLLAYQKLNNPTKVVETADRLLAIDPENFIALASRAYYFPATITNTDPDLASKLEKAERAARKGLEVVPKQTKPPGQTDEQFAEQMRLVRALFHSTIGLVALQRKDYAAGKTEFEAAIQNTPKDPWAFYRLALCHVNLEPANQPLAIWNLARAISLKIPIEGQLRDYARKLYIRYHGSDEGFTEVLALAAGSVTPPADWKIVSYEEINAERAKLTLPAIFNDLKAGGEAANRMWALVKGMEIELQGLVLSNTQNEGKETRTMGLAVGQEAAAAEMANVQLGVVSPPEAKNLKKGDVIHFTGTIEAYQSTPTFVLTLGEGKVSEEDIPKVAPKPPKPAPKPPARKPRARTTQAKPKPQA